MTTKEKPTLVKTDDPRRDALDETPPLLGSWRNIYAVVIGTLVVLVTVFWLITRAYRSL